jgi:hypothetical protein
MIRLTRFGKVLYCLKCYGKSDQTRIVAIAKDMIAKGEVMLSSGDEDMVV